MSIADRLTEWRDAAAEIELDQVDWEQPGTWPKLVKVVLMVLAVVLALGLGYFFVVKAKVDELNSHQGQEAALRQEYQTKAFEAANLDALRDQMTEMNQMFGALVSQLPSDTEVPGLLEDITAIASTNGLEINSQTLQEEVLQEFYVELPIDIVVTGTYHDLGAFVSGIAGLPRIVTLHDFEILPVEDRPGILQMSIVAKTYRYKDEG
ncbi:MAG: type 4a pilus biogenesis protein PilO [Gammaproteobacteria bacterium]|nr:type 4a pilus biogenesis protein PilO [Gammaproteobacteria bacterium]MBT8150847.1 type 4a pilus biogenesis protein PilO [Gammaproteobacteria bacterium]NND40334.1 type 4a pilus biogenesis protein PilO [Pseudomonadales bacterium]NNM11767.1 type 4a pilus biogenesis protein PilO [Pseudomonadales bacterium]RZV50589.1 MAG: pilus assembly protein PilP [Pseudomonadales bacterium]